MYKMATRTVKGIFAGAGGHERVVLRYGCLRVAMGVAFSPLRSKFTASIPSLST